MAFLTIHCQEHLVQHTMDAGRSGKGKARVGREGARGPFDSRCQKNARGKARPRVEDEGEALALSFV